MKPLLMANENFPLPSVVLLRERGYDIFAVAETAKSISDQQVLSVAVAENRWILTFDRDYGELIYARVAPVPPAVLYRVLPHIAPMILDTCLLKCWKTLASFTAILWSLKKTAGVNARFHSADL